MNRILHSMLIPIFLTAALTGLDAQKEARSVLDQLQQSYPSDQTLKVAFTLKYKSPEGKSQSMEGTAWRKDNSYRIELPDQWIVSNGKTSWNYLKDIDEIHIEDASASGEGFNPANFMTYYQEAGFQPGLTLDEKTPEGQLKHISFKPGERNQEIVKARLELLDGSPENIYAFYRNGMQTHIDIHSINKVSSPRDDLFELDPSSHPDAYVEDLRLD